jgi:hypothetical protein
MNMLNVLFTTPRTARLARFSGIGRGVLSTRRFTLIGMNRLMAFSPRAFFNRAALFSREGVES